MPLHYLDPRQTRTGAPPDVDVSESSAARGRVAGRDGWYWSRRSAFAAPAYVGDSKVTVI